MRNFRYFSAILILLFLCSNMFAQKNGQKLVIDTKTIKLTVGESVQLVATVYDKDGNNVEAAIDWSVNPDDLGHFEGDGLFISDKAGNGKITAMFEESKDTVPVQVKSIKETKGENTDFNPLSIVPKDCKLVVGETIQFKAVLAKEDDSYEEVAVQWSLEGDETGTLSAEGLFTATGAGVSFILATLDELVASTVLIVTIDKEDISGHKATIYKVLETGKIYKGKDVYQGQVYNLSGLPHPLNIVNGGALFFPSGCLKEDIDIHMVLPNFAKLKGNEIDFGEHILNAIALKVYVNQELIEPYYFEKPLTVILPFKTGLLKKYGISIEDLAMYFTESGAFFNETGITDVVIDTIANKIIAQVEHFSTLAIKQRETSTAVSNEEKTSPQLFELLPNYPNPFNPATTIPIRLTERSSVKIDIYNSTGAHIKTLYDGLQEQGLHTVQWDGYDEQGHSVASGVYLVKLQVEKNYSSIGKMILMR